MIRVQRDALAAHVASAEIARSGLTLEALRADGVDVAAFISEAGQFDAAGLRAAAAATAQKFGIRSTAGHVPTTGTGAETPADSASWSSVLKG